MAHSVAEMSATTEPTPRRADVLKASPRMFESNLLDKLSRVHPSVPLIIFVPAILAMAVVAVGKVGVLPAIAWTAGGYLVWTLTEYWLHRLVFHFQPDHPWGQRMHFIIHGVHHDHPNDPMRLVMPPSVSIPLSALFYLLFWVLVGGDAAPALGVGFWAGYLFYDMTHYYVHHHRPKSKLGKRLRENHMRHHFQDGNRAFGVSFLGWDRVFGTAPKTKR